MDGEIITEYAALNRPRTAALREVETMRARRDLSALERRLDEIEAEIIVARRRCERSERDRLGAAAHRPRPLEAGYASLLVGDTVGEIVAGR